MCLLLPFVTAVPAGREVRCTIELRAPSSCHVPDMGACTERRLQQGHGGMQVSASRMTGGGWQGSGPTFGPGEHLALELGVVGLEPGDTREPDAEVAASGGRRALGAARVCRLERVVDGAAEALPRLVPQERELGVVQPDALHAGTSAARHALGICAADQQHAARSGTRSTGCGGEWKLCALATRVVTPHARNRAVGRTAMLLSALRLGTGPKCWPYPEHLLKGLLRVQKQYDAGGLARRKCSCHNRGRGSHQLNGFPCTTSACKSLLCPSPPVLVEPLVQQPTLVRHSCTATQCCFVQANHAATSKLHVEK